MAVDSIETEDGNLLLPTPAPSAWEYLLVALFPLLGFFVPWGTVRAIEWVAAGFTGAGSSAHFYDSRRSAFFLGIRFSRLDTGPGKIGVKP